MKKSSQTASSKTASSTPAKPQPSSSSSSSAYRNLKKPFDADSKRSERSQLQGLNRKERRAAAQLQSRFKKASEMLVDTADAAPASASKDCIAKPPPTAAPPNVKLRIKFTDPRIPSRSDVRQAANTFLAGCSLEELSDPKIHTSLMKELEDEFDVKSVAPYLRRLQRAYLRHLKQPARQDEMKAAVMSEAPKANLHGVCLFRSLLSINVTKAGTTAKTEESVAAAKEDDDDLSNSRLIDIALQANILPRLVAFLGEGYDGYPELQYQTAWLLCNIVYGTAKQTAAAVDAGMVRPMVALFDRTTDIRLKQQAMWCLANVSGDSKQSGLIVESGLLGALVRYLEGMESWQLLPNEMAQHIAWFTCNVARYNGHGPTDATAVWDLFTIMGRVVMLTHDDASLQDLTFAMERMLSKNGDLNLRTLLYHPDGMFSMDIVYRVGMLLSHSNAHVRNNLRSCIKHITERMHEDAPLFNGILDHSSSLFSKIFSDWRQMVEEQKQQQANADGADDGSK